MLLLGMTLLVSSLHGCTTSGLVPPELQHRISRDVPFTAVKGDAEKFKGRLVVVGGQVLSAQRFPEETQIEVLQLPLDRRDRPILNLVESKGRFLAFKSEFLDPALVPPGSNISVIAEVVGNRTVGFHDDRTYTYPTLKIKTLKIWPKERRYAGSFPFWDRWSYPFDDPWTHPYWGAY